MKNRDIYLSKLLDYKDTSLIKVITGVRRCGKSSLLDLLEMHLVENGISKDAIVRINFESLDFDGIATYKGLNEYVKASTTSAPKTYVLLDEVQMVAEWERAVNSLRLDSGYDLYITGSNSHLLSSEISTLLSGRYVEIKMLPLSFKEYLEFNDIGKANPEAAFSRYLEYGGFPGISEFLGNESAIAPYLEGIYNTIVLKDVILRNAVRDPALLESITRYLAGIIGNLISSNKVSGYLTSIGRKTTSETVDNYIRMLESAYIFYQVGRYDIRGKARLKTQGKYYIVDTGIRNELVGQRGSDYGSVLENVVFFELKRRGYSISRGQFNDLEVDFVATKASETLYVQVTSTMLDEATRKRELEPLQLIPDNYRKIILSMDKAGFTDFEGIESFYLLDFLLE